jgi:hypothetical protein
MEAEKTSEDRQRVSLYLERDVYLKIKNFTKKEGMTMNGFFSIAIENEMDKRGIE